MNRYRPNVAAIIFNEEKKILLALRAEYVELKNQASFTHPWQTVQGGVDAGESEEQAIAREVYEELGLKNLNFIAKSKALYSYDFPEPVSCFKGQLQRWFLAPLSSTKEKEINFKATAEEAEFVQHKWVRPQDFAAQIADFKRDAYASALEEFWPIIEAYEFE